MSNGTLQIATRALIVWAVLSLLAVAAYPLFETGSEAIAIDVEPHRIDLGIMRTKARTTCKFQLKNTGHSDIVVDTTSTCGCVVLENRSHALHPRDCIDIPAAVEMPDTPQQVLRSVHFNYRSVDNPKIRRIFVVDITADVRAE